MILFECPGIMIRLQNPESRVALPPEADQPKAEAVASMPGMTIKLRNGLYKNHTIRPSITHMVKVVSTQATCLCAKE
jgi:hypothetical protein